MALASFLCWFCRTGKPIAKLTVVMTIILTLAGSETVATRRYLFHWRDSVSLYKSMINITPNAPSLLFGLGNVFLRQEKFDKAIIYYRQALHINPRYDEVYNNLGYICKLQGKHNEATSYYHQALRYKPDLQEAHYNLGMILKSQGKFDEAMKHFHSAERAGQLSKHQNAEILDTLAAAYAATGQFSLARATAQKALLQAKNNVNLTKQIKNRIELYKQAKPYIEE